MDERGMSREGLAMMGVAEKRMVVVESEHVKKGFGDRLLVDVCDDAERRNPWSERADRHHGRADERPNEDDLPPHRTCHYRLSGPAA